ncbi:hypothetical protein ACIBL5_22755 [Streptomyces sp. NPDC050516]|uniref:hypothetical protein n=1 Tax=Streptomyces sp. NPDC050516 TaxID=3365621 RepID=UPI00378E2913
MTRTDLALLACAVTPPGTDGLCRSVPGLARGEQQQGDAQAGLPRTDAWRGRR